MPSTREYFGTRLQAEKAAFVKVLSAVPEEKADYRPHERNMSARDLVWLMAHELEDARHVVESGKASYTPHDKPGPVADGVAVYQKNLADLQAALEKADDAAWAGPAQYLVNGVPAWETTVGDMVWGFLFDAIHHRGQLSTHLRPMGAKVPSIYGPSGDES